MGSYQPLFERRRAGVLVPLSALKSAADCGIGDLADLRIFIDWAANRNLSLIQLLPVSPISPTAPFPYSAYSAFGLDFTVIALNEAPEVKNTPAAQKLLAQKEKDGTLQKLRQADRLDYAALYELKWSVLEVAFKAFQNYPADHERKRLWTTFVQTERSWLEPFALFTALKNRHGWRTSWTQWPEDIRNPNPQTWERVLNEELYTVQLTQFVQWIAHEQWDAVHAYAKSKNISFMGDMPIYVGGDSADVWSRRNEFDLEADGGAPPDYFNWLGQNWAAPLYDWNKMKADGFQWWKARVQYNAHLFDALRFDHFRGVSEYWRIPRHPPIMNEINGEQGREYTVKEYDKVAWFWPIKFKFQFREKMSLEAWRALSRNERFEVLKHVNAEWIKGPGEDFVRAILSVTTQTQGTSWAVEDLGADMDEVFALRDAAGLAGMRVAQFFGYDEKGRANPHVNPAEWPENSLALSDTHDLPPLKEWIETLSLQERERIAGVYGMPQGAAHSLEAFEQGIWEKLFYSPSRLLIFSLQTLLGLGSGNRTNIPGTVGPHNWTWRMPMDIHALGTIPRLETLIKQSDRQQ
jgi:4-alpha-glucanotransferase